MYGQRNAMYGEAYGAVITGISAVLAHTPNLVEHGSKPSREGKSFREAVDGSGRLRTFDEAVSYGQNQAFIGSLHPRDLPSRPWTAELGAERSRWSPVGEIMPEDEFIGLLAACDEFRLISLTDEFARAS